MRIATPHIIEIIAELDLQQEQAPSNLLRTGLSGSLLSAGLLSRLSRVSWSLLSRSSLGSGLLGADLLSRLSRVS